MSKSDLFRSFRNIPEIIRLAMMSCVRFPLSPSNAEEILRECSVDVGHEAVRALRSAE